ncbi:hypothetical protein, partial [Pradoshia sp.]
KMNDIHINLNRLSCLFLVKFKEQVRSIALQPLAFRGEEDEPPRLRLRGLILSSTSRRSRATSAPFHQLLIMECRMNKSIEININPNYK